MHDREALESPLPRQRDFPYCIDDTSMTNFIDSLHMPEGLFYKSFACCLWINKAETRMIKFEQAEMTVLAKVVKCVP